MHWTWSHIMSAQIFQWLHFGQIFLWCVIRLHVIFWCVHFFRFSQVFVSICSLNISFIFVMIVYHLSVLNYVFTTYRLIYCCDLFYFLLFCFVYCQCSVHIVYAFTWTGYLCFGMRFGFHQNQQDCACCQLIFFLNRLLLHIASKTMGTFFAKKYNYLCLLVCFCLNFFWCSDFLYSPFFSVYV